MPLKERLLTAVISAFVALTAHADGSWGAGMRWQRRSGGRSSQQQRKTGARAPLFFLKRAFPSSTSK